MGARPLSLVPNTDLFNQIGCGDECNTRPTVSSNPMHHPKSPQSKDTKNQGSAPLVFAPRHPQSCSAIFGFAFVFAFFSASPLFGWWDRCGHWVEHLSNKICRIRSSGESRVRGPLHDRQKGGLGTSSQQVKDCEEIRQ